MVVSLPTCYVWANVFRLFLLITLIANRFEIPATAEDRFRFPSSIVAVIVIGLGLVLWCSERPFPISCQGNLLCIGGGCHLIQMITVVGKLYKESKEKNVFTSSLDGFFRSLYCLGRKKKDYKYKELLQYAT